MSGFINTWITIECPKCNYQIDIQLIDIKNESIVYCHNCKQTIRLKDKNASAHTAVQDIDSVLNELNNVLKKLGK